MPTSDSRRNHLSALSYASDITLISAFPPLSIIFGLEHEQPGDKIPAIGEVSRKKSNQDCWQKPRILVIEDDPGSLQLISYLFTAYGYTVLSAVNGEEGIEQARREMPDLIVCDIYMPRLDGYGVAHYLKSNPSLRRIPLVAVTAIALVGDRGKVLAAGFDGYIAKPITPETFVQQVEKFMPEHNVDA